MTTTEELVSKVNVLLEDLKYSMDGLFKASPAELAFHLSSQLKTLQGLEEELERRVGVSVPSTSFISKKDRDPNIEWLYRKKHNRALALERLKSAITAHRIALAHLAMHYHFYSGRKELSPMDIKESEGVRVVERSVKLGRLEILPHLAYSGDILRILSQREMAVREGFKELKARLREKGRLQVRGYRIEVEYWENNRLKKTRVDLPSNADIDAELRKRFGRKFRWRVLTSIKTHGVLINNHYTVDNLALAYASLSPEEGIKLLALDIFRYYFLTSERERENITLYPGIRGCVECHYSLFDEPFREEKFFRTGFGSMMLLKKCEIEGLLYGKRHELSSIPNYLLGGVILYGISPFDEKRVAGILGISEKELEDALWKVAISGMPLEIFGDPSKFERFMPKEEIVVEFLKALQGEEDEGGDKGKKQRRASKENKRRA